MLKTTPVHERTSALCVSHAWRRWAGYIVASSYELTHDRDIYRLQGAYRLDLRRENSWLKWLGMHTVTGYGPGTHVEPRGEEPLMPDIIACPGLDYCALANARSIPSRCARRIPAVPGRRGHSDGGSSAVA